MSSTDPIPRPHGRGAPLALASAALFGASAPLAKKLLQASGPLTLAALFYLGAGLTLVVLAPAWRRARGAGVGAEAALRRSDLPLLLGGVLTGGVLGPLLLMLGLQRVSAVTGSLLLNLEPPFTIFLAVALFREHLGRRQGLAAGLILLGAVAVGQRPGDLRAHWWGVAAIAAACLCWSIDTNLSQRLSLRDPIAFSRFKSFAGAACTLGLARLAGERMPGSGTVASALLVGGIGYGVSAVLFVRALRDLGAARVAAYFATAPFFGVVGAVPLLGESLYRLDLASMALMGAGVALLMRETHEHHHAHEEVEHDHAHVHDEHHRHAHGPDAPACVPHAHPHRHPPLAHAHPHAPDLHHRHAHET